MNDNFRFPSIIDMLEKQAESLSNEVCLLYPDQTNPKIYATLTYKQLNQVTNHIAEKFSSHFNSNSSDKKMVVCCLANSNVNYLLSIIALLKLEVIVFPLSVRNSEAALIHLLEKSDASYLFYDEQYSSIATKVTATFGSTIALHQLENICISELINLGNATFKPMITSHDIDQCRIIFHSSGSTSFPKPVRLTTRCIFGWFESYAQELGNGIWRKEDTTLAGLPLFHIIGLSIPIMMWYVGGSFAMPLTVSFPASAKEIIASVQYPQITQLFVVTLMLEEFIPLLRENNNIGFQALARLKFVAFGGASYSADVCKELVENGVNLLNVYGSTEMGYVCISQYDSHATDRWQRVRPLRIRDSNIKFVPIESQANIYELSILSKDPFLAPDFAKEVSYTPGDIFLEDPPGSGYYIIQGRKDDLLVHTTGEKTNPLPMEQAIRLHPIVKQAVVVGHQRFCCAVLIQLNIEQAFQYELHEIERQVLAAVDEANKDAPKHSRIVRGLVKILPIIKTLPITAKGNVIRKLVDVEYSTMIAEMYEQFLNQPKTARSVQDYSSKQLWTKDAICVYLQRTVADLVNKPIEVFADYSKSLYSLSVDSLTTVELRNILSLEFGHLNQNIIYEFSSISALADQLWRMINNQQLEISNDSLHYRETEKIIDKYINLMKMEQNQNIITSENNPIDDNMNRVILLTGANGSLGSHILLQLLRKTQVTRIYCFVRGEDAASRLRSALNLRKLDVDVLLDTSRIIVLPMDLSDDRLGQTPEMYHQLQNEVTDIIHAGWKMDFNMTINEFDRECLQGLYQLLRFASGPTAHLFIRFHFISSISAAGSGLLKEIEEEPLPRQIGIALPQGYGQAKYAGEHICLAAMNLWGVPIDIYRLGQISGDSETGVWNTNEMIPLIICSGGGELGILPNDCETVDWIPVNYAASSVVDLAMRTNTRIIPPAERVHHIFNPNSIDWPQLLEYLKLSGLQFRVIPIEEWLQILLANPKNPAYVLSGFFEKMFGGGKRLDFSKYKMEKTMSRTKLLEQCHAIDQELVQRYLKWWWEIDFLKSGYNPSV